MPKITTTAAQRVAASRARALEAGGRRLSNIYLKPDAAQALDALLTSGYASNATQAVSLALLDAAKTRQKSRE